MTMTINYHQSSVQPRGNRITSLDANLSISVILNIKVYILLLSENLRAGLIKKELKLKDILILFDRNSGVSVFQNFMGYNNPMDDAEWVLERNPQTRGFILRPVSIGERDGLWIGEYTNNGIVQCEVLCDKGASLITRLITNYAQRKVPERRFIERLNISLLKEKLRSEIVQRFKYYECPSDRVYHTCDEVEKVYEALKEKYGNNRVPYSNVADEILAVARCSEAVICPFRASNAFERIYNLNKVLKARGFGEIKFVSPGIVQIT